MREKNSIKLTDYLVQIVVVSPPNIESVSLFKQKFPFKCVGHNEEEEEEEEDEEEEKGI